MVNLICCTRIQGSCIQAFISYSGKFSAIFRYLAPEPSAEMLRGFLDGFLYSRTLLTRGTRPHPNTWTFSSCSKLQKCSSCIKAISRLPLCYVVWHLHRGISTCGAFIDNGILLQGCMIKPRCGRGDIKYITEVCPSDVYGSVCVCVCKLSVSVKTVIDAHQ